MADSKVSDLAENTDPQTDDILYIVDDPGGTPASEYVEVGTLIGRYLIEEQIAGGASGTITFSNIPGTFNALRVEVIARTDKASATEQGVLIAFNSDTTGANYRRQQFYAYNATTSSAEGDNRTIFSIPADDSPSNSAGMAVIDIIEYAGTTFNKQANSRYSYRSDAGTGDEEVNGMDAIEWESTNAITTLALNIASDNFVSGSVFRLYGLR